MKILDFRPHKYAPQKGILRKPGECDILRNTTPMRVEGAEVTRYGYSGAGLPSVPSVGGTPVTVDYWEYVSTETPSAKEVLFAFSHISSTYYVHIYSWVTFGGSSWADGWVLLNESLAITLSVDGSDTSFTSATAGLSASNDYYNGWVAVHASKGSAFVKDYNGTTKVFTVAEHLGGVGQNWLTGESATLYRSSHETSSFLGGTTTYPGVLALADGAIRGRLGKSSSALMKDFWVGYVNRTFFAGESRAFTYQGMYAGKRECAHSITATHDTAVVVAGSEVGITTGYTYWTAIAPIFDGSQVGKLQRLSGTPTVATLAGYALLSNITVNAARMNKRITGFRLYVASDYGDTSARSKPLSPYNFVKDIPLTDSTFTEFTYDAVTGNYVLAPRVDKRMLDAGAGQSYQSQSGYLADLDIIYSHDLEITTPQRQWIGRVYDYTNAKDDLDSLYTNPRSSDGVIQYDIFPAQDEVYRHRVKYGDQTVLTGIVAVDRGNILALKDQSITMLVTDEQPDGSILIQPKTISDRVGSVSPIFGHVKTPFGVYFVGHDDIYVYDGELRGLTLDDWYGVYRAIAYATKQAAIVWYRPDEEAVFCKLGSDVYAYYLRVRSWRQVSYADALAGYTVKRDGTFVWWKTGGTAYKFDTSSDDAGTAISVTVDTGTVRVVQPDESLRLKRVSWNRNQSSATATGTLDIDYEGTANVQTYSSVPTGKRTYYQIPPTTRQWADRLKLTQVHSGLVEFNEIEIDGTPFKKKVVA